MKRQRLNLALAGIAAVLAVAVFLAQEKDEKSPPLTALGADGVSRIRIEHPGAAAIALERQDGRWRLTEPVQAAVDGYEINGLLALATLPTQQTLDGAPDLKALELQPPLYRITLNDQVLEFGGVEPLKYWRYIRANGTVHLVDDPPSAALDKDYADLVSKTVVDGDIEAVEAPGLKIAKGDKDAEKLFENWKNAKAMWNELALDVKNPKGDALTLTLNGRKRTFVVVERDPQFKLYAPELGIRYVLPKTLVDELLKRPVPKPDKPAEAQKLPPA